MSVLKLTTHRSGSFSYNKLCYLDSSFLPQVPMLDTRRSIMVMNNWHIILDQKHAKFSDKALVLLLDTYMLDTCADSE